MGDGKDKGETRGDWGKRGKGERQRWTCYKTSAFLGEKYVTFAFKLYVIIFFEIKFWQTTIWPETNISFSEFFSN